jgi:type II secretory pathway pseudopilin PulG
MRSKGLSRTRGYSLPELLVGTLLFTIITGAVFSLLLSAQLQYQGESGVSEVFQQANVAIDQIVRDVHSAGYPPRSSFNAVVAQNRPDNVALPFAWSPNYPGTVCTVGATCLVPGDFDLVLEADIGNGVQWIRYSLQGTTLMRGVTRKTFADPVGSTEGLLVPYLENVQNVSKGVAVFSYGYDNITPVPLPIPNNIRTVNVKLIVQSARKDPQTHDFRTITVTGQAVRFNPDQ